MPINNFKTNLQLQKVILQETKEEIECWIYLLHDYKSQMLQFPYLISYSSNGEHGQKYVSNYLRDERGADYWTDVKCKTPKVIKNSKEEK